MKKLTLNETWTECLKMWKWIASQKRKGDINSVHFLKEQWLGNNGYKEMSIRSNCFFCEYISKCGRGNCGYCPGKKIDPEFSCCFSDYDYSYEPILFYKEIKRLNNIRLKRAKNNDNKTRNR